LTLFVPATYLFHGVQVKVAQPFSLSGAPGGGSSQVRQKITLIPAQRIPNKADSPFRVRFPARLGDPQREMPLLILLAEAGLTRVNVSLDSLKRKRFKEITGHDRLPDVLGGIKAAQEVGLAPIKINVVVMRGVNEDELPDFARLTLDGWNIRFIELMPILNKGVQQPEFVSAKVMWDTVSTLGTLQPCSPLTGNGPANYYQLPGAKGTIGFITPVSDHFCIKCNRLRLTADGKLLPCLLAGEEIDLRSALRAGASPDDIRALILKAVASKPEGHRVSQGVVGQKRPMTQVGG
jgi:cyclic pyranopterin phosphate synthase